MKLTAALSLAAMALTAVPAFADAPGDTAPQPTAAPGETAPADAPLPADANGTHGGRTIDAPAAPYIPPVQIAPGKYVNTGRLVPGHVTYGPQEPSKHSRVPAYVGTALTIALVGTAGFFYFRGEGHFEHKNNECTAADCQQDTIDANKNMNLSLGFGIAAVVAGAATAYLYSRSEAPARRLIIVPTGGGGGVSYSGSF
ncbi:MAG TPA: hypothetical protein VGM88_34585 [Kofleriaceae bacterium]|jgi:hypothetical protein